MFLHFNPDATAPGTKFQCKPFSRVQQPAIEKQNGKKEKLTNTKKPSKLLENQVTSSNMETIDIQNDSALHSLFNDKDSYLSDTSMSIATNKQLHNYSEDDDQSSNSNSLCNNLSDEHNSSVLDTNSSKDMLGLIHKQDDAVSELQELSAEDSKYTPIVIDDDDRGLSYNDMIPISLAVPSTCSGKPSVSSVNKSNCEGQIPPPPVLVEDGGVMTEK
ncbi:hypothetical protein ACJ72_01327 [Emergomyces africanus]|uniref:Uncharacterized protein n=1 Tax=Emergomyces africanus TaxID=1955775 RepID=A0A1B7P5J2_9EURO|nr:hypothetical protein ACJ72_01327 [Emergomyces africanus]